MTLENDIGEEFKLVYDDIGLTLVTVSSDVEVGYTLCPWGNFRDENEMIETIDLVQGLSLESHRSYIRQYFH